MDNVNWYRSKFWPYLLIFEGPTWPEQHTVKLVWPNNGKLPNCKGTTQGVVAYLLLVEAFVIFDRHLITWPKFLTTWFTGHSAFLGLHSLEALNSTEDGTTNVWLGAHKLLVPSRKIYSWTEFNQVIKAIFKKRIIDCCNYSQNGIIRLKTCLIR